MPDGGIFEGRDVGVPDNGDGAGPEGLATTDWVSAKATKPDCVPESAGGVPEGFEGGVPEGGVPEGGVPVGGVPRGGDPLPEGDGPEGIEILDCCRRTFAASVG